MAKEIAIMGGGAMLGLMVLGMVAPSLPASMQGGIAGKLVGAAVIGGTIFALHKVIK